MSRSDHNRSRFLKGERLFLNRPIPQFILADHLESSIASQTGRTFDLNVLHEEALVMEAERDEQEMHKWHTLFGGREIAAMWEWTLLTGSDSDSEYAKYVNEWEALAAEAEPDDEGYYQDDLPNMYTHDDCWLPYNTIHQARETFTGRDFLVVRSGW